jgi:hypothetical protein
MIQSHVVEDMSLQIISNRANGQSRCNKGLLSGCMHAWLAGWLAGSGRKKSVMSHHQGASIKLRWSETSVLIRGFSCLFVTKSLNSPAVLWPMTSSCFHSPSLRASIENNVHVDVLIARPGLPRKLPKRHDS